MTQTQRHTVVVQGRLAMREVRLAAARSGRHGIQAMSFEQMAVRLAGGFARPIDDETLRATIQAAIPSTGLGELDSIKSLPGMVAAAADTLKKAWRAGVDLASRAPDHPRLAAIAGLEAAVLAALPSGMLRPADIAETAQDRIGHAPEILGELEICGLTELSPCWRPLLARLADNIPVIWNAGPRNVPAWLEGTKVEVRLEAPATPAVEVVSAANAHHEALEAMRWVRSLLVAGIAPSDIAIAAASPADYDDHFLALRADANIDLHFVHGTPAASAREGQAAAALADILVRGLSQSRLRRLSALCKDSPLLTDLPDGWTRVMPADAPLASLQAWTLLLARLRADDWPDGQDHTPALRRVFELLARGADAASEAGEAFLTGRARAIWRKALLAGPAAAVDVTLENLRQDDGLEACVSVAWMPASALAASPRKHVRLIGLNSSRWPRNIAEDRLIPHHVVPTAELDPLPVNLADRRDFETILATTRDGLVLSRSRRDSDGRLLGRSPLLPVHGAETYLRRNAAPAHAFSESDRLFARPGEFADDPQAISARICWRDWRRSDVTAHDGLIRADHPLIDAILARTQSANSLKRLLRNPLSFVWVYAFGWRAPESGSEPLVLDALEMGDLVHQVLDRALCDLEDAGGFANSSHDAIVAAVHRAAERIAGDWESERAVPPAVIWRRTLDDVGGLAAQALTFGDALPAGHRCYAEVPFGGAAPKSNAARPWDAGSPVSIPGTGFNISGYIDRLDISADGKNAAVRDYKTGRPPKGAVRLNGGRELQRCLYAFATKALLGDDVTITASLLFPRDQLELTLDDPEAVLTEIGAGLSAARTSLAGGLALPGPDTGGDYDDLAFALPANARATYCKRKLPAAVQRLGVAAQIWEAV